MEVWKGAPYYLCGGEERGSAISIMALLGGFLGFFLQHAEIQLVEVVYEDYGTDMVGGRYTCASCEAYRLCSLAVV